MSGEHGDCRECGCPGECQWYARAEAAESDRAALREENGRLREALRDVAEWLPALKPAGHSGDEDGGQCYEDCERCQYEAIEARIDAALTSTPVPAVDPATCDHDVSCARCGTRWTR